MKKLLMTALVLAMVVGFGATAFGAYEGTVVAPAFSDIAGHDAETELSILAALGVYSGSAGIGNAVKPDDPITRAEFCKVLVVALGRNSTAVGLSGLQPTFTDGASIPTWAWGYINVAVYMGIINGYADGSFGASKNVTYAEAVTMLIRAVPGHVAQVPAGVWPYNYLFYGVDNEFTGPVDVGFANLPSTRGDIARMLFATMQVNGLNKDGNELNTELEPYRPAMLYDRIFFGTLSSIANVANGQVSLTKDTVETPYDLADKVFLAGGKGYNDLFNLYVMAVLDADDLVAFIGPAKEVGLVTGVFDSIDTTTSTTVDYVVLEDGTKVPYLKDPGTYMVTVNGGTYTQTDFVANCVGADVTIHVDDKGNVQHIVASMFDEGPYYVTAVTKSDVTVTPKIDTVIDVASSGGSDSFTIATSAIVTMNGQALDRDKLAKDDVLLVATTSLDGTTVFNVSGTRQVVEGTYESDRTVFPGEKHYTTLKLADASKKEYRVLETGDISAPLTYGGKFALSADGYLFHAVGYSVESRWVYCKTYETGTTGNFATFDLLGNSVTYKTTTGGPDGTTGPGNFGFFAVDSQNQVNSWQRFGFDIAPTSLTEILAVDAVNKTLTVQGASVLFISKPVVYKMNDDTGAVTFATLDQVGLWEAKTATLTETGATLELASVFVDPVTYYILIYTYNIAFAI